MNGMEKRIELEKRGKQAAEITELNLDNSKTTTIVGLTEDFVNLETLSLINVGLTSLKGFPSLPNLKKLELSDNRISSGLNMLHSCPKLANLNLSGNKIVSVEALETLKELKNLTYLDLFNNEVTTIANYRDTVFSLLPNLKYLDGLDKNCTEVDTDEEDEEVNGNDDESEEEDEDEEGLEDGYDEEGLDDECLDDEGIEEEEDFVPLHAVYDNLDDDESDADYEGGHDHEERDIDTGDDIEDNSSMWGSEEESEADTSKEKKGKVKEADKQVEAPAEAAAAAEEESPARGKKRKHEGEEVN